MNMGLDFKVYDIEMTKPKEILSSLYIDHNPMSPIEAVLSKKNPKLIGLKHSSYNQIIEYLNDLEIDLYFWISMSKAYEDKYKESGLTSFNFLVPGPLETEAISGMYERKKDLLKLEPVQITNTHCHEEKTGLS